MVLMVRGREEATGRETIMVCFYFEKIIIFHLWVVMVSFERNKTTLVDLETSKFMKY